MCLPNLQHKKLKNFAFPYLDNKFLTAKQQQLLYVSNSNIPTFSPKIKQLEESEVVFHTYKCLVFGSRECSLY